MWEGVGDRTELQLIDPPLYWPQPRFFPVLLCCSTGGLGAHYAGCWFSLPHLVTNGSGLQTDWISCALSYITVQRLLLLVGVIIALIQSIHVQGYNSDIPRPDAPVIYIGALPIFIARPGRRSIYNTHTHTHIYIYICVCVCVCYHPGWRLMRLGYRTCFHTLYDENSYIYIYIYIL